MDKDKTLLKVKESPHKVIESSKSKESKL